MSIDQARSRYVNVNDVPRHQRPNNGIALPQSPFFERVREKVVSIVKGVFSVLTAKKDVRQKAVDKAYRETIASDKELIGLRKSLAKLKSSPIRNETLQDYRKTIVEKQKEIQKLDQSRLVPDSFEIHDQYLDAEFAQMSQRITLQAEILRLKDLIEIQTAQLKEEHTHVVDTLILKIQNREAELREAINKARNGDSIVVDRSYSELEADSIVLRKKVHFAEPTSLVEELEETDGKEENTDSSSVLESSQDNNTEEAKLRQRVGVLERSNARLLGKVRKLSYKIDEMVNSHRISRVSLMNLPVEPFKSVIGSNSVGKAKSSIPSASNPLRKPEALSENTALEEPTVRDSLANRVIGYSIMGVTAGIVAQGLANDSNTPIVAEQLAVVAKQFAEFVANVMVRQMGVLRDAGKESLKSIKSELSDEGAAVAQSLIPLVQQSRNLFMDTFQKYVVRLQPSGSVQGVGIEVPSNGS